MMLLLDTDIIIDIFRNFIPAVNWLKNINDDIAITGYTAMELIQGCENKSNQEKIKNIIDNLNIIWLSQNGCYNTYLLYSKYHFSHQIGLLDSLIAQTAIENNIKLHTFNTKHYLFIKDLIIIQPYNKQLQYD